MSKKVFIPDFTHIDYDTFCYKNNYADKAKADLFREKPQPENDSVTKPYISHTISRGYVGPEYVQFIGTGPVTNMKKTKAGQVPEFKSKIDLDFDPDKRIPYNLVNHMRKTVPEWMWMNDPGSIVTQKDYTWVANDFFNTLGNATSSLDNAAFNPMKKNKYFNI